MLFDSLEMEKLRKKYEGYLDWQAPEIVVLDRRPELSEERKLIESILSLAPKKVRTEWIKNLLIDNVLEHNGVWFEIRLFDWLQKFGQVDIKPTILGTTPDFRFKINKLEIIIEAYARFGHYNLVSKKNLDQLKSILKKIRKSYYIFIAKCELISFPINSDNLTKSVIDWLDNCPDSQFNYLETSGNSITFSALKSPGQKNLIIFSIPIKFDSDSITKSRLAEKVNQYKELVESGYPYIVAVYLESMNETVDELIEALHGRIPISKRSIREKEIKMYFDKIGLYYCDGESKNRNVSGVLIFKSFLDEQAKIKKMQSWYVQNPDANIHIPPEIFPKDTGLYLFNEKEKCMEWVRKSKLP